MTEEKILYCKKGLEHHPRTIELLQETNDLTIGQIFIALSNHHKKNKEDYKRWISYEKNHSEFCILKNYLSECDNDLERVHLVCDWLDEEKF